MATTDAKPAFRLPWGSDRGAAVPQPEGRGDPTTDAPSDVPEGDADPVTPGPASQENENDAMIDAAPTAPTTEAAVDAEAAPAPAAPTPPAAAAAPAPGPAPRKTNKFLADLTKAMQAAAESARTDTLERVAADAKTVVESIHAASSTEATELRKRADDDVAAVREWSKNEIARIREETDERIAHRKERLEHEIEEHAARIEARIERVQQRVAAFETEMQAFFQQLLDEQDPTRFASLAEALPEPPPLDVDDTWEPTPAETALEAAADATTEAEAPSTETTDADAAAALDGAAEESTGATEATADAAASQAPAGWPSEDPRPLGAVADDTPDPRLAMLGLDQDFAAAEAEALDYTPDEDGNDEPMPELGDDVIAARLAGIVAEPVATPADTVDTRIVVVGLVSVASIAGFKRHLSRIPGVGHVGVTSGPEGEFVFTATHEPSVVLRDVIPSLPGFAARITGDVDGGLAVTAHDPETER